MSSTKLMQFDFTPRELFTVSHLRFRRLWISLGVVMILTVTFVSVIDLPEPVKGFVLHDKLMHTITYACLMGWFAQIYRHDLTRLVLVIGLIALGIAIEFIQGSTAHRQYEFLDMVANTSGVVLAWALAYTWVGGILAYAERSICTVFTTVFNNPNQ